MPPTPDDVLTADQIRVLEEIAADATAPALMRETARRVLADPTRPRQAYADDLRAAMDRLAGQIPGDVPLEELRTTSARLATRCAANVCVSAPRPSAPERAASTLVRAVVDTNVWISCLLSAAHSESPTQRLVRAYADGQFTAVFSRPLLLELGCWGVTEQKTCLSAAAL